MMYKKSSYILLTIALVVAPFLAKAQTPSDSAMTERIHMVTPDQ